MGSPVTSYNTWDEIREDVVRLQRLNVSPLVELVVQQLKEPSDSGITGCALRHIHFQVTCFILTIGPDNLIVSGHHSRRQNSTTQGQQAFSTRTQTQYCVPTQSPSSALRIQTFPEPQLTCVQSHSQKHALRPRDSS